MQDSVKVKTARRPGNNFRTKTKSVRPRRSINPKQHKVKRFLLLRLGHNTPQFRPFTTNCFETKVPTHCCVLGSSKKGYRNRDGTKRSFFKFPIDNLQMKKKWLHAIRRDEGKHFKVAQHTKVCCLHFRQGDIVKTLAGKNYLKAGVVPSVFPRVRTSPRKRKEQTVRNLHTAVSSNLTRRKLETSDVIMDEVENEMRVSMSDIESNSWLFTKILILEICDRISPTGAP